MTASTPEAIDAAADALVKAEGRIALSRLSKADQKYYRELMAAALAAAYPLMEARAKAEALADLEAKHADEMDEVMQQRDEREEWADQLAYAIAPMEVIGEHSSGNNPWENALYYIPDAKRVKAEALREAADEFEGRCSMGSNVVQSILRVRADEIEEGLR